MIKELLNKINQIIIKTIILRILILKWIIIIIALITIIINDACYKTNFKNNGTNKINRHLIIIIIYHHHYIYKTI
jgi:hypothetical protein